MLLCDTLCCCTITNIVHTYMYVYSSGAEHIKKYKGHRNNATGQS